MAHLENVEGYRRSGRSWIKKVKSSFAWPRLESMVDVQCPTVLMSSSTGDQHKFLCENYDNDSTLPTLGLLRYSATLNDLERKRCR